jgi:hypothetical protein
MQQHPGHYARLLTSGSDPVDLEIMRDLNRTFPNHVFFHQRQGPGQQSLFHVLRAYSAHDPQVGAKFETAIWSGGVHFLYRAGRCPKGPRPDLSLLSLVICMMSGVWWQSFVVQCHRQGPGQQSLFHVLRAYRAHDRQVRR